MIALNINEGDNMAATVSTVAAKSCDVCGSNATLTQSRAGGITRNAYFCKACTAFVACHVGTVDAMGTMALPDVRKLRKELHKIADPLWKSGLITRDHMYVMLGSILNLGDDAHVSQLDRDQLETAIKFFSEYKENQTQYLERRKEKRDARRAKRATEW